MSSSARRGRRVLASAVVVSATLLAAPALPSATSTADAARSTPKRCPTVGRTLAFERYDKTITSRVWRLRGRTYGCTIDGTTGAKTRLLTRAKTSLLRLQDDTVAWTTTRTTAAGVPAARVSAYDLTDGGRFLSAVRAVPRRSPTEPAREGTVEQLQVESGFFVAWVANGNTIVVGGADPGDLSLTSPDGTTADLPLDGSLAVAGSYPAGPELTAQLVGSLKVASVPGDHGDSDDCAYSYEIAYTWSTGPGQAFDARMRGTRTTPQTCR